MNDEALPPGGRRPGLSIAVGFAYLLAVAFVIKPLLVPDETRYLAVAWEMWNEGSFLVPQLNGDPYTHKPPFLFWLMHLGWTVFGVNSWWPRLLAPIALLLNAVLIRSLGRRLFPDRPEVGHRAAVLYLSTFFPAIFMTQIMFDLWVVCWVLLGLIALVEAHRGAPLLRTAAVASLALGLGIVTKGPVLLLYLLPAAMAARFWSPRWKGVLATGLLGLVGGAALALAWAIPAGIAGGEAYREAIFWGQTAGRMKDSFDHARPFWWYLPLLPIMLYPWIWWRHSYTGWRTVREQDGWLLRLVLWSVVPQFLVFSAISGKQPHYLLPLFPMLMLALSRRLEQEILPTSKPRFPAVLFFPTLLGVAMLTAAFWLPEDKSPEWLKPLLLITPGGLLLYICWLQRRLIRQMPGSYGPIGLHTPLVVGVIVFALGLDFREAYDIRPVSERAAAYEAAEVPMAFYGMEYAGQFHFQGRLTEAIANPHNERQLREWLDAHPQGKLFQVVRRGEEEKPYGRPPGPMKEVWHMEFGSRHIQVWDAAALRAVLRDRGK